MREILYARNNSLKPFLKAKKEVVSIYWSVSRRNERLSGLSRIK